MYCFIQCHCHYNEGTSQKFCFPDKAFIIILSFITPRHILCCSCSIISQNWKQNMYLLTEWESRTGKYLTQNQDVWIENQIFYCPALPNSWSVNKNFIIWLNIVFFFWRSEPALISLLFQQGCVFPALSLDMYCTQKDFFIWFSYEIAHGAIQVIL